MDESYLIMVAIVATQKRARQILSRFNNEVTMGLVHASIASAASSRRCAHKKKTIAPCRAILVK